VIQSSEPQLRHVRYSARLQARLDAERQAKLEELTKIFHRKRAPILRYVMQWGIGHSGRWTIDPSTPTAPCLVPLLVEPALLQQVQDAAAAHGVSAAAWLRQAMRHITLEDFLASWRVGEKPSRSHDSGYYGTRFMLRLDDETSSKLATLTQTFHRSAGEVIRQLIAQATPQAFPPSWHLGVEEHRLREGRSDA